jgi:glutamate/tyrosine decarboxylase-like PLP-dependent enzyme
MEGRHELEISRKQLSSLIDEVAELARSYWGSLEERVAYPATSGAETTALFSRPWLEDGIGSDVLQTFKTIADHSRPSGGRFFGYVFGSGEPVGALSELLIAALNQNVTSWRSGPAATTIEHAVVGWLGEAIGCGGFRGSLCGGGSTANLMGLAMAREAKCPANEHGAQPGVVYCSAEVHFSIPKAVALLGIGRRNLRIIATNEKLRMRTDALREAIAEDRQAGRVPIAVVATVGTVVSGAIDPIREIAAIARTEDLWLHADGAYGALAALAVPDKFDGLALADSISLDAHKWLYQTVDCSCLLYRDPAFARAAFSHNADYVRALSEDATEAFLFFEESIELTRRFRALKLWMSLQYHGRRAYRQAIERDLRHAQLLAEAIEAHPELELLAPVALSAVCFRHRSEDNEAILRRVIARGRVYLSNGRIEGRFALRACFVNHRTTKEDVRSIINEVMAAADEINR